MWINTCNLTEPPSVPEEQGSISDLNWFFQLLAQSAGSNGKPLPPSTWRRLWKKDSWLKRLSGRTSKPSTAALGVESWITSLRATRASRSLSPGSVLEKTILDTFGLTLLASLARLNRHSYFSKTCLPTSASASTRSSATLKDWASKLRQDSSLRVRLVLHSDVSGFSSSLWNTPNVPNRGPETRASKMKRGAGGIDLQSQVRLWAAPGAGDDRSPNPSWDVSAARHAAKGQQKQQGLRDQVPLWPAPNTGQSLTGHGARGGKSKNGKQSGRDLPAFVKLWPTPAARDSKGANSEEHVTTNGTGRKHLDQLANFASHCFHLAPKKSRSGAKSSTETEALPQLNPRFVCWLMGWPWINLGTCDSTVMESYPSLRLMLLSPFGPLSDHQQWLNAWRETLWNMVTKTAFIAPVAEQMTQPKRKKVKAA
jgi:hypothetical protein